MAHRFGFSPRLTVQLRPSLSMAPGSGGLCGPAVATVRAQGALAAPRTGLAPAARRTASQGPRRAAQEGWYCRECRHRVNPRSVQAASCPHCGGADMDLFTKGQEIA